MVSGLQAALRKEALAKKRREKKALAKAAASRGEKEEKEAGAEETAGATDASNATAGSSGAVKASRWEADEGEGAGGAGGAAAQPAGPQSVMARTAQAEIAAFSRYKEQYRERNGDEAGDGAEEVPEPEENVEGEVAGAGLQGKVQRDAVPGLGDLDDLDGLDGLDDDDEDGLDDRIDDRLGSGGGTADGSGYESTPGPAPPGPARPGAGDVAQYAEVEVEDMDEDVDTKAETKEETVERDILMTNKQHLFKRKMSMMQSCRDVDQYQKLNRISEGTYGVVYRGRDLEKGTICALKRLKLKNENAGFPMTSVREINVLLALSHPNIVNVSEVVLGQQHSGDPRDDQIFMVMDYAEHDLGSLKHAWTVAEVKCLMLQLLSGVAYLHENYVMHRDLKPANILYNNKGQLKICDFGLARTFSSKFDRDYTQMVVTLWYRAPELLLGTRKYSSAIDVWSVGCVMAQLLTGRALLTGSGEIDQLRRTYDTLGDPEPGVFAGYPHFDKLQHIRRSKHAPDLSETLRRSSVKVTDELLDLLTSLLDLDPRTRISAQDALDHPWFRTHPLPKEVGLMPTFASSNEQARR